MSSPEAAMAHFEAQKHQLITGLNNVADSMRACVQMIEGFNQLLPHVPYTPNGMPIFSQMNGQFSMPPPPTAVAGKRKSRNDDVEGKPKKVKKIKDPNAPKRPASSYLLFQNDIRQELKAKHPGLPNNELLQTISKLWADMPKEERAKYDNRQKAAKEEYIAQKLVYEGDHTGEHSSDVATPTHIQAVAEPKAVVAPPIVSSTSDDESSNDDDESSEETTSEEEVVVRTTKKPKTAVAPPEPAAPPKAAKKEKVKKSKA